MSKKDEFMTMWASEVGGNPHDLDDNPAKLAEILNSKPELRRLFREAVAERTADGAGFAAMFAGFD